ncbi:MAG: OmpA family protein [Gammaproteobacteria bacterium]
MTTLRHTIAIALAMTVVCSSALGRQSDMNGSSDYPGLARVTGTTIIGYSDLPYDAGGFVTSSKGNNFEVSRPEGERTRIVYLGTEDISTLQLLRNYEKAFADFGAFDVIYSCADQECPRQIGSNMTWALPNQIASVMEKPQFLHSVHNRSLEPKYLYGTVTKDDSYFHLSMYAVRNTDDRPGIGERPVVHIEIVRAVDFEPSLVQQSGAEPKSREIVKGEDMPGSADYPDLPRVEHTRIVAYSQKPFDAGSFINTSSKNKYTVNNPEGVRTRIVYIGQEFMTTKQLQLNYQKAFDELGDFQQKYSCYTDSCPKSLGRKLVWEQANQVPGIIPKPQFLHAIDTRSLDPAYSYGTIEKDDSLYHVSVFIARNLDDRPGLPIAPVMHVEIVEQQEFEATLVFVDADEMVSEINSSGAVSLYGIQFEYDSASITENSSETIAELAKVLSGNSGLNVFVVGHTDNQGSLEYNEDLSLRRAQSVVQSLVSQHGVSENQLHAVGVGQVSPTATNTTDEGRSKNRRVEIVAQ